MNVLKTHRGSLIILSIGLLAGCTPPPAVNQPTNQVLTLEQRVNQLTKLTHWTVKGGLAIKNRRKSATTSLYWQQSGPNTYQLKLIGPLGSGNLALSLEKGMATLSDGKNKVQGQDPQSLLFNQTGYILPISSLYYWVRGLANPSVSYQSKTDSFGHLKSMTQQGWQVNYERYTSEKQLDLPSKIKLKKGGIMVKVIISQWQI